MHISLIIIGREVYIRGKINFPKSMGRMKQSTYLTLTLKDSSFGDTASHVLTSKQIDLSGRLIGRSYTYRFYARIPLQKYHHRLFTITAVLNMGWKRGQGSMSWIRVGDYYSVKQHRIVFQSQKVEYLNKDLDVFCYGKF